MDNKSEKLLENEKLSAETTDDDEPALDLDINVLQQHASRRLNRHFATMKYVAQNTNIKVPVVYDWNGTAQNPIKTPYIFMERLPGQHLYQVWDGLTIRQKIGVLRQWNIVSVMDAMSVQRDRLSLHG
ncbi:unnamed protein product [Rhizophagus irregularis]|nr:unnamed protein product [Rhizophagus irregularis]